MSTLQRIPELKLSSQYKKINEVDAIILVKTCETTGLCVTLCKHLRMNVLLISQLFLIGQHL